MVTKLIAAELATTAGCNMVISIGNEPQRILTILKEARENQNNLTYTPTFGTHFIRNERNGNDRRWWVLSLAVYGTIVVDSGAILALKNRSSLFAAGIVGVNGTFNAQQCVKIVEDGSSTEIARGLVNYSSAEIFRIKGCKSSEIEGLLGYCGSEFVIHRDNLALINKPL